MKTEAKQAIVDELADKLRSSSAFYLTDFTGLNVKSLTDLRARLRKEGLEYLVVKNTLAERALQDLDMSEITDYFRGPTALVIGQTDPVLPAKVIAEFAKEHDNRPAVKAGIVERRPVSAAEIGRLAMLPPRDHLLAILAGALESPLAQFAGVLQAKLIELAGLLDALRSERAD